MNTSLFFYAVTALLTAFILTVLMGPYFIPMLRRMKFGQEVRDDGPEAHLKKQGTPTMGGIMFLVAILLATLLSAALSGFDAEMGLVLFLTAGFGFVGFLDDYLKIKKHQSEGLNPKQKLLLQLLLTVCFSLFVFFYTEKGGTIYIPFTGIGAEALKLSLPVWLYVPFVLVVVLGTDNGVNFTDGLDGLCSSVTAVVAAFFVFAGLLMQSKMSIPAAAVIGALMGFLLYNVYPAKVFMGDTGSLALGGFVAGAAVVLGLELYIPIVGFIYMIEVISVIIQVTYFKKTGGKRFFKMAPIHHHFELLGNSETRIVAAFSIVTVLLAILSAVGLLGVI